jgi:hypothetical protein
MLPVQDFIRELAEENEEFFSRQPKWATSYWAEKMSTEATVVGLQTRFWNEFRGAELLARFMFRVEETTLRMMVGRQVGDEAKHAFYVQKRLAELGASVGEPFAEQQAFYAALDDFLHPEEFFAAQQFTVETESVKRNEQALQHFDETTAEMFRRHINNDEVFHVRLGHAGLAFYCVTEWAQQRARAAARLIRDKHVAMSRRNHAILRDRGLIH